MWIKVENETLCYKFLLKNISKSLLVSEIYCSERQAPFGLKAMFVSFLRLYICKKTKGTLIPTKNDCAKF